MRPLALALPDAPRRVLAATAVAAALALAPALAPAAFAHGDLTVNELETLAIRDFEGMEDSFPWGGFEIWDVYVGEGYNESLDADGVYFKVNFAGDGTKRAPTDAPWTVTYTFTVGEESFERSFAHDGATITTDFESLQWTVADGNVLQVKAWVPVADWQNKSVRDITLVSAVGEEPRDSAPGGVHAPATQAEAPIQAPQSPIFPPLGEGRMVDEVPLTGPSKFLEVSHEAKGNGAFVLHVKNPLKEQGQHVLFRPLPTEGWNVSTEDWGLNLNGSQAADIDFTLVKEQGASGVALPLRIDLLTDIGGRQTLYAVAGADGVQLVEAATLAAAPEATGTNGVPLPSALLEVAALAGVALLAGRKR